MGFLEGIVVIYLRELYYPQGFDFPLKLMSPELVRIEWIREISTLIMLAAVGIIAGRNNLQRLLYFLVCIRSLGHLLLRRSEASDWLAGFPPHLGSAFPDSMVMAGTCSGSGNMFA